MKIKPKAPVSMPSKTRKKVFFACLSLPMAVQQAFANPEQGNVVAGQASFNHSGKTLTVRQQSSSAIINWQSFDIQADETTRFVQPNSSSAVLNRVNSGNPSAIYGTLSANGRVYLVNPNGVVVGKNGNINAQSFVASTLDVSNAEFLNGGDLQFSGDSDAAVINLGHIEAAGGDVFLIAHQVVNEGEIVAKHGDVGLAAGTEVLLKAAGDKRISIKVSADNAKLDNKGLIEAARIKMTAANNNPYALAINQEGVVRATGAIEKDGRVILSADTGATRLSGTVEAAAGDVKVLGDEVELASGSVIDVSAANGGGTVLVGGNYQGQGDEKTAKNTTVNDNVRIDASATENGDGGAVIVWADEKTEVAGEILARGGINGGNGGFIETSGKESIAFSATIDASAPEGENGLWLIDPESITIDRTMADSIEVALDNDTNVLVTTHTGWPLDENDTVTDETNTQLYPSAPDLTDQGHITLDASITKRGGDQAYQEFLTVKHRGDVPVGAHTKALAGGEDLVYLLRFEVNSSGDTNLVSKDIVSRDFADTKVTDSAYQMQELEPGVIDDLVYQVEQRAEDNSGEPTLEFLSPEGSININAPIISLNGALDVVLNAGSYADFTNRQQNVNINADIITNGGDLTVRAPQEINIAANTLLSTRDVFGVNPDEIRYRADQPFNIDAYAAARPEYFVEHSLAAETAVDAQKLTPAWQENATSVGWSGDITLMTDKNIGYSNFFLFYRSDITGINIGDGARLLAHSDDADKRSGSVRILSVANLTDAFEDFGWLGVRNFVQSSINIGDGSVIKGGAIDVIADARADADVGALIAVAAAEVAESTGDTGLVGTATFNDDDTSVSAAEDLAARIMDTGSTGNSIEQFFAGNPDVDSVDYQGAQTDIKIPFAKIQKKAGPAASELADEIPFVGEFLNFSPVAIAIAEADASVNIGNSVTIDANNLVTIRANAEASANGGSTAPGLAMTITGTDSRSNVNIGQNSHIYSSAENLAEPSSPDVISGNPFFKFTANSPWGQNRSYLTERSTGDAIEIASHSSVSSVVSVTAAALTEQIASDYLQKAEEDRARSEAENTQSDKTVNIDSPVDIAFGYMGITNNASLNIAEGSEVKANQGSVDVSTIAASSAKSKVVGGKVVKPKVTDTGTPADENGEGGSSGSVTEPTDANDIANIAISVQYLDVDVSSFIDGTITGKEVNIGAASVVGKNTNTAQSDNGYENDLSGDKAVKKKIKEDNEFPGPHVDKLKKWIGKVGDNISGKADKETKQEIPVENTDPKGLNFGLAGAVAVAVNTFDVENVIGSNAVIKSVSPTAHDEAAINIWSNHTSGIIHNSATAGVHAGRKNATSAAIAVGVFDNQVATTVADGALIQVDHGSGGALNTSEDDATAIRISAETTIESPFSTTKYLKKGHKFKDLKKRAKDPAGYAQQLSDPKTMAQGHIKSLIKNGNLLTTSWANSYFVPEEAPAQAGEKPTTEELNAGSDRSGSVGVSGSFNLLAMTNHAQTTVGSATIEVLGGVVDGRNDIGIVSDAWAHTVMAAGTIAPPTFDGNDDAVFDPSDFIPGEASGTGVGGAINLLFADSSAKTHVLDNAVVNSEQGDVIVDSISHYESMLVQLAGGKSGDVGISGTFGLANINHHAASLVADGARINADDIMVRSWNTMPGNLILSGGFAFSGSVGIGAGVAISNVNRSAHAELGFAGLGDQASDTDGEVTANSVEVDAASTGFVTTIGLSGGVQAPDTGFVGTSDTTQVNESGSGEQASKTQGGVGVSGSVSVNLVTSNTTAKLNADQENIAKKVNVTALDSTDITGISGGASLTVTGGVAVTGAASINRIENHTTAEVDGLDGFSGYDMNVSADSIGRIQGIALGLAATTAIAGEGSGPNVAVAGSFTYNDIRTNTQAGVYNSFLQFGARPVGVLADATIEDDEDALRITATDGSQITAVAGAVAIDATPAGDASVGAAVAVNTMQGNVNAKLDNTTVENASAAELNDVAVAANRIAPIYAFGVAGAAGTSKLAASASVAVNTIDTLEGKGTYASITNSVLDGLGGLTAQAGNESQIFSLAGAISATTGAVAAGGALSISEIGGDVSANIDNSDVDVSGNVNALSSTASATSTPDPTLDVNQALADAKVLAKDAALIYSQGAAGLIAARDEENPPVVQPVDTIDLFGGESAIYTLAAAGGGSSNVAAFGSGTVNIINQNVTANIFDSSIRSGINTTVLADNNAAIRSGAGSLAISTGAAAVGGAASYNTLRGLTSASIENSIVDSTGNVTVAADRSGIIETLTAGAAVASSVGVQGSAAISTFADTIKARVVGGNLSAENASIIAQEDVESTTAAGAVGGGGTAAIGASAAILVSENSTEASIVSGDSAANVDARQSLAVRADSKELHNTSAMTASVSGVVGVAGSVGIKVLNNTTMAKIGDGSVINQVESGNVTVHANSQLATTGAAGAVGIGIKGAGVGAGLDLTVLNGLTTAMIGENADVAGNNILVEANSAKDLASFTAAGGGGFVGVGGAVSILHVGGGEMDSQGKQALGQESYEVETEDGTETRQDEDIAAYANGMMNDDYTNASVTTVSTAPAEGDTLAYIGASDVNATGNVTVKAKALHDVDVNAGALGAGVVGVSAGVVSASYHSTTAAITKNANLYADGNILVDASDKDQSTNAAFWQEIFENPDEESIDDPGTKIGYLDGDWFTVNSFAGSAGAVALGASIAAVHRNNNTLADIRGGTTDADGNITVQADRSRHTRTFSMGAMVGAAGIGVVLADLVEKGDVTAQAGGNIGVEDDDTGIETLSIDANAYNRTETVAVAAAGGIVTGSGAIAAVKGESVDATAKLADNARVFVNGNAPSSSGSGSSGSLNIHANGQTRNYLYGTSISAGVGVAVGATEARLETLARTNSVIGNNSNVYVSGHIKQKADMMSAEFLSPTVVHNTNVVYAEGASASLLAGVSSLVAVSDLDQQANVSIGDNVGLDADVSIRQDANVFGHSIAKVGGGSVAGGVAVGVMTAENKDRSSSDITIGQNTNINAQAFNSFQLVRGVAAARSNAIAGSLVGANLYQNSRLSNDATRARTIIGDGSVINTGALIDIYSQAVYSGSADAVGTSSGANTYNAINADVNISGLEGSVYLSGATLDSQDVNINTRTTQSVYTDFRAEAYGANASTNVDIDTSLSGHSTVQVSAGSVVEGSRKVDILAESFQPLYSLQGLAKIGAATGSTHTNITNNLTVDSVIRLQDGGEIAGSDISLVVDDHGDERTSDISAKVENTSATFFLGSDDYIDNQYHNKLIQLDGNIVGTSAYGRQLDIVTFGQYMTVNGSYTSGLNLNDPIAPSGSANIVIDAGDGNVQGAGEVVNASHYLTDVNITAYDGITLNGVDLIGEVNDMHVSVSSGNGYEANTTTADAPSGGNINVFLGGRDAGARAFLNGLYDAGTGAINISRLEAMTDKLPISGNAEFKANQVGIDLPYANFGTEETPFKVTLLDSATSNAYFAASAGYGVYADIALQGYAGAATIDAVIGDINAGSRIHLNFADGINANGQLQTAVYNIDGAVTSFSGIEVDANGENTELVLNGLISSGGPSSGEPITIDIYAEDDVRSNWQALEFDATLTGEGDDALQYFTLSEITNDGGAGVVINAANLSGNGSVFGNSGGFDVTITNHWQDTDILQLRGISLLGSPAGVSINGDSSVASNQYGGIQIERIDGAGANTIDVIDPYSSQLIIQGTVETSGAVNLDLANAGYLGNGPALSDSGSDSVLRANALSINIQGELSEGYGNGIGFAGQTFNVDVGSGGLDIQANGRVYLADISGDLVVNNIQLPMTTGVVNTRVHLTAADGDLIAANNAGMSAARFMFAAAGDIVFSNADIFALNGIELSAHNIDVASKNTLSISSLQATGNVQLSSLLGAAININSANVLGSTSFVSDGDISAFGDFTGSVSVTGITSPSGNHFGSLYLYDANNLLLGDIRTGFSNQEELDGHFTRIAAAGDISQEAGTSISLLGKTSIDAAGDITLTQVNNQFDNADWLSLQGNDVNVVSQNALRLFNTQAENLSLSAAIGDISQFGGSVTVAGDSWFNAAAGNIALDTNGNRFSGTVTANTSDRLSLSNAGNLQLGQIAAGNGFMLLSSGNIIGHEKIVSQGESAFLANFGSVVFDNADNELYLINGVAKQDVTIVSSTAIEMAPLQLDGTLSITADNMRFVAKDASWQFLGGALENHVGELYVKANNIGTGDLVGGTMPVSMRDFIVDGDVTLDGSVIDFDRAQFAGTVNINASTAAHIANNGLDLNLGRVVAPSVHLSSIGGSIIGQDVITATNSAYLSASENIVLDNSANDFGKVYVFNYADNNHVTLKDANDLVFNNGNSLASLDIETGGAFSLAPIGPFPSWVLDSGTSNNTVTVSGDARLLAGSLGNFQGGMTVGGNLWLGSNHDLHYDFQNTPVIVAGNLDLYAANNLLISNKVNQVSFPSGASYNAPSASTVVANNISAGGNAIVEGINIYLDSVDVAGDLTLNTDFVSSANTTGREINISGPVYVGGQTNITASGNVTMNHSSNQFVGQVNILDVTSLQDKRANVGNIVSGNDPYRGFWLRSDGFYIRLPGIDVDLQGSNTLALGDVVVDGSLTVQADAVNVLGDVASHEVLTLQSNTIIGDGSLYGGYDAVLDASGDILLGNANVDFANGVSVWGRKVALNSNTDIAFDAINITDDISVTASNIAMNNTANVLGDLSLTSTASDIYLTNTLSIGGDASFNADGYKVTAGISNSVIGGAVNVVANEIDLYESDVLLLGALNVTGNARLQSHDYGIQTRGDSIHIGGDVQFESLDADLILDDPQLQVDGLIGARAQNITVSSDKILRFDELRTFGDADIVVQAKAIDGGSFRGNNVTLTATDGSLTGSVSALNGVLLAKATGDVNVSASGTGLVDVSGENVRVSTSGNIVLDSIATRGDLSLFGENIHYDKALNVVGNLLVSNSVDSDKSGEIHLTHSNNWVGGTVSLTGKKINYAERGDIVIASVQNDNTGYGDTSSALNITAASGDVKVLKNDSLSGFDSSFAFASANVVASGDIILHGLKQNDSSGALALDGSNITLTSSYYDPSLSFGAVTARGDLTIDMRGSNSQRYGLQSSYGGGNTDINVAGLTTINGGFAQVRFDSNNNVFSGGLEINAGSLDIVAADGLLFHNLTLSTFVEAGQSGLQGPFPGNANMAVTQGDIVINGAIDAGALSFDMGSGQGNIIANNVANKIVATEYPGDMYDPSPEPAGPVFDINIEGTAGHVDIVDSTDLSIHQLNATGNVNLQSQGDVALIDVPGLYGDSDQLASLSTTGDLTVKALGSINTGEATVSANDVLLQAGGDITLNGGIASTSNIILASGGNFHNQSVMVNPLNAAGRWLVYSTRPDENTGDMAMAKDFYDYGISFNPANPVPSFLPAGNGLLYQVLPVVEGISLSPIDQTIEYGNDIDRSISNNTIGSLSGTATGRLLVDGVEVDADDFGINLPASSVDINPSDLSIGLNESVITRSTGGYINVGDYNNAIVVSIADDASGSSPSFAVGGSSDLTVTAKQLTLADIAVDNKTYDGSTEAHVNFAAPIGLLVGDVIAVDAVATFVDKNAGSNKQVNISGIHLQGSDAGNYVLAQSTAEGQADIQQKQLDISLQAQNKTYDGTVNAALNSSDYTITGFIAGEGGELSKDGVYNSANVLTASSVQVAIDANDFVNLIAETDMANYQFANNISTDANIQKANLQVVANDAATVYNGLVFSGGNGYSATGFVAGESLADIQGNVIYGGTSQGAVNAGDYAIALSGLHADNYAISYQTGELNIAKANLNVNVNDQSYVYDGTSFSGSHSVNYSGFVNGETQAQLNGSLVYSGSAQTAVNAGQYTITASGLSSQNYVINYTDGQLNITPKALTISLNDAQKTYDGVTFTGGNGFNATGFVTGESLADINGTLVYSGSSQGAVNAGSYDILAEGLSSNNYAISYQAGQLTVDKKALNINLTEQNKVYDGSTAIALTEQDFAVNGLVNGEQLHINSVGQFNSKNVVDADTVTVSLEDGSFSSAGGGFNINNYSYSQSVSNNASSISQAELLISANNAQHEYTGVAFSGDVGVSTQGLADNETLADLNGSLVFGGDAVGAINAGNYVASASGLSSDNYNISWQEGSVVITPKALTVSVASVNKVYDGVSFNGGSANITGFVNGEDSTVLGGALNFTGNAQGAKDVGSYEISANGLLASNYAIDYVDGNLAITPAALTVTVNDAQHSYDGTAFTGGNGVSYSGFVNGETAAVLGGDLSYSGEAQGAVNAGNYALNASGLESNNYQITYQQGSLSIDPRLLTTVLKSQSREYNGSTDIQLDSDDFLVTGFVAGEQADIAALTGHYNNKDVDKADSVTASLTDAVFINAVGGFDAGNYRLADTVTNNASSMRASKLTIKANDAATVYNGLAFSGGNGYSTTGFVAGESLADIQGDVIYSGTSQGAMNAGGYTIELSGLHADNYAISYQAGELNIAKASLNVNVNDQSYVYDGTGFSGSHSVDFSGFVNGETQAQLNGSLVYGGSAQTAVNAGQYIITASGLNSQNYAINYTDGQLNITPKALTVSVASVNKVYDGVSFNGGSANITGFVNGEDSTVLGGALNFTGNAQGAKDVGSYEISANGLLASNYAIDYVDGNLAITPAALTVTVNDAQHSYDGTAFTGGNGVSYSGFVNGETAAVLGGDLSYSGEAQGAVNAGNYALNASGLESNNYQITYQQGSLSIDPRLLTTVLKSQSREYNGSTDIQLDSDDFLVTGFVAGEHADIAALTGHYNNKDVDQANSITVPLTDAAFVNAAGGFDAGNYRLADTVTNNASSMRASKLTIKANDAIRYTDGQAFSGGNGVSVIGLKGKDTLADLAGQLVFSGSSQGASQNGQYIIRPEGLSSNNYDIVFEDGFLNIATPLSVAKKGDSSSALAAKNRLKMRLPDGRYFKSKAKIRFAQKDEESNSGDCRLDCNALSHVSSLAMNQRSN